MPSLKMDFWHTGAAQKSTFVAALIALTLLATGQVHWAWAAVWFVMHQTLTGFGAVGAHTVFCHGARGRKVGPIAEKVLALGATLLCIGSPLQWSAGHTAHHDHADTDQDPHNAGTWRGLFLGNYVKPLRYSFRYSRRLVASKFHRWLHNNALLVPLAFATLLLAIGIIVMPAMWYIPILFVYLAPLFTALMAGAIHNVVSHGPDGPRDMPWLFLLMPWEWSHGSHHEDPTNPNKAYKYKWMPDPSYYVLKAISKPA